MRVTVVLLTVALFLIGAGPARADGTATPIPTPTSPTSNLRPTPTLMVITPGHIDIDTSSQAGELADKAIGMYRVLNFGGIVDFVIFVILLVGTLTLLFGAVKRAKGKDA